MLLQSVTEVTTTTTDLDPAVGAAFGVFYLFFLAAVYVLTCLPLYGTFKKAGHPEAPAWAAWVPIYNTYAMCKLAGRPGWWVVLFFIPVVNVVVSIILFNDLSKSFGYGTGFTVGLVFLTTIFLFVLWLGPARYQGPAALTGPRPYV